MTDQQITEKPWNIFARELENILSAHHLQMDALVNLTGISAEKARYLTRSLYTPKGLPVLNREEMKVLEQKLQLRAEEILRLRAGLLAAFIQSTFVDRIDQSDALLLAEQAFPTILRALQARAQGSVTHEATRWGAGDPIADDELDAFFDSTWHMLHNAEMELQLSYGVDNHTARVAKALAARTYFEQASMELESAKDHLCALQLWRDSYATSQQGLETANRRLEDLGL
jgi:hypothetical protein